MSEPLTRLLHFPTQSSVFPELTFSSVFLEHEQCTRGHAIVVKFNSK